MFKDQTNERNREDAVKAAMSTAKTQAISDLARLPRNFTKSNPTGKTGCQNVGGFRTKY